jgi:HEAT repeat protein
LLALQSEESLVRQAAINACRHLSGPSVLPNVLAVKLPDLAPNERAIALAVLGESGDSTVAAQLAESLSKGSQSTEGSVSLIGVLGKLGGVDAATRLLELASLSSDEAVIEAAQVALAVMPGA